MENMKRAISAFMALVLVLGMLPGVPLVAAAEEAETLPETVALETTETVTVEDTEAPAESVPETTTAVETIPETTAAAETIPETTAEAETTPVETEPAETVPVETVPAETVPAETVPAETVPVETMPEETVPAETEPAETIPEVEVEDEMTDSEEAVDGIVLNPVTDIQVSASVAETYVGDKVYLSAKVTPADASIPEVVFYVVEEGSDAIAYDQELLTEKGILRVEEPGTLVIAARATDLDEPHDSASQETGGTVKVIFNEYGMAINKTKELFAAENVLEYNAEETEVACLKIMSGKTVNVSAHYKVNGTPSVLLPGIVPSLKWELAEGDEKYAVLKPTEDGKEVTVTSNPINPVTGTKVITLIAREETLGIVDSIPIAVYPVPYKVGLYDQEGVEYTNKTMTVALLASEYAALKEEGKDYLEVPLSAQVWPLEADEPLVWTSSDKLVQIVHPDKVNPDAEEGAEPEKDTSKATLRVYFITSPDTTTITVTSKNYPSIKSKIIIKRKWCLESGSFDFDEQTERLSTKGEGLLAGKSFQMKVYNIQNPNAPERLTSKTVKWSLAEGDDALATISAEGVLTAKKGITSGGQVTVKCAVIDNEEAYLELPVIIRPLAVELQILAGDLAEELEDDNSPRMTAETILNGKTIAVDTANGRSAFKLEAVIRPDDEYGALQKVKWTSSNGAVATVDPDTDEIIWKGKNGTTVITAAAQDGSGKKATVILKFGAQVREIEIVQDENFFLRSGQGWTFSVNFTPANPTDKGLTWSLVNEADKQYVTLSATGRLVAKTVYEEHVVAICATAKDGSGVSAVTEVTIKPKTDGILTLKGYGQYVTGYENYVTMTTQTIPVGDSIDLEAYILGEDNMEEVKWRVSSTARAELSDEISESTTVTMLNTGTVTVVATSMNDPKKTASVTLKGIRITDRIEWTHTHEQTGLACGKSLVLKAKSYDIEDKTPTVSKLEWLIEEGGEKYAKVVNGRVTSIVGAVGPYDEPVDITVIVRATDGSLVEERYGITIYPAVQSIVINRPEEVHVGTNTFVLENPGLDSISMSAQVWPANALDTVTWKTSNKAIAEIDPETGDLICKKAGTITITATANDGTGKRATFKLTILQRPTDVHFDGLYPVIAGGRTLKLKPILLDGNGDKILGKKLEWDVLPVEGEEDGTAYVTSIAGGVLRTKKVTEPKMVRVTLKTVEKYDEWESDLFDHYVWIYPDTQTVTITESDGSTAAAIKWCYLDAGSLKLSARTDAKNGEVAFPMVTWTSSNKNIAEVDVYGNVIFKKIGTVRITAAAVDGSGKKDTIQIVISK